MIIIIESNKKIKMQEIPNFSHRKLRLFWLRKQRKLVSISNIESVDVQVKDIKQMINSDNPRLISLYAKFNRSTSSSSYDDEDYITISKDKEMNRDLIYALISADWLINYEDIKNKSTEEIKQDCIELENIIAELEKEQRLSIKTKDKIKLLKYKLACLSKIKLQKNGDSVLAQKVVRRKYK